VEMGNASNFRQHQPAAAAPVSVARGTPWCVAGKTVTMPGQLR